MTTTIRIHANTEYAIECDIPRKEYPPLTTNNNNPNLINFLTNAVISNVNNNNTIKDIALNSKVHIVLNPDTRVLLSTFLVKGGYYSYQVVDENGDPLLTGSIVENLEKAIHEQSNVISIETLKGRIDTERCARIFEISELGKEIEEIAKRCSENEAKWLEREKKWNKNEARWLEKENKWNDFKKTIAEALLKL